MNKERWFFKKYKHGKRDRIEPDVIRALESSGCIVEKNLPLPAGTPDLTVYADNSEGKRSICLVEVKTPGSRLSKTQKQEHERLREKGVAVIVVEDPKTAFEQVAAALYVPVPQPIPKIKTNFCGLSMEEYLAHIRAGKRIIIHGWDMTDFMAV